MNLKKILNKARLKLPNFINHEVTLITDNSKNVVYNSIFFANKGYKNNGNDFIEEAILKGAKTIVHEEFICKKLENINYIKVDNSRKYLTIFLNIYYKDITKKIKLIGVTGTNGKSSIATLIHSYLEYMGKKSMLIGTDGIIYDSKIHLTENTTPNSNLILKLIYEAKKKHLEYVVMEVSSIAIKQSRVFDFDFDVVIFANLSHDHLDYHKTITDYRYTKGIFLSSISKDKTVILNKDDDSFDLYNTFIKANVLTYSINNFSDLSVTKIIDNLDKGLNFSFEYLNTTYNVKSYLIGRFNIYNILASICAIISLNFSIESYLNFIKIFNKVDGRMNLINFYDRKIIIDYAHTVEGVISVLESIKNYNYKKLTVVIGTGGNRDKEKREIIAKKVLDYASKAIFTTDNPRNEDPMQILNDMTKNLSKNNYEVIVNRKKAIIKALKESVSEELILILGKGNEKFQIVNEIKYPYNDYDFVKKIISRYKI